jgi:hypothetical protein
MKLLRCAIGPATLALGLLSAGTAAATCTPQVSVVEVGADQPGGGILGQYVMTTGDLCGLQIVALAVDNNESLAAYANLSGWNAMVVTDDFWDQGIELSRDDFGSGSSYHITTGAAGIGSFLSFFGPSAALANLYWLAAHYGGPVVDHSTAFTAVGAPIPLPEDAFQFETGALASMPIAFLHGPALGTVVAVSAVPEPPAATLFAIAGLAWGLRRRRVLRTG